MSRSHTNSVEPNIGDISEKYLERNNTAKVKGDYFFSMCVMNMITEWKILPSNVLVWLFFCLFLCLFIVF